MTSAQILKLITDEQSAQQKRRNTALARGLWSKANDYEVAITALGDLKSEIVNQEQIEANQTAGSQVGKELLQAGKGGQS